MNTEDDRDENEFIARLVQRDETAFNELVSLYENRVFTLIYRMLGRREEAEDISQEVFVQVFRAIDTFRQDSKLSTWIYRIAINLCRNRHKYNHRRSAAMHDELDTVIDRMPTSDAAAAPGNIPRPDDLVESVQMERLVRSAMERIEDDFRHVLILRDVEDLPYDEIASITGLAEGTVKSRIHRARAQLRELVEHALRDRKKGLEK